MNLTDLLTKLTERGIGLLSVVIVWLSRAKQHVTARTHHRKKKQNTGLESNQIRLTTALLLTRQCTNEATMLPFCKAVFKKPKIFFINYVLKSCLSSS